MLHHINDYPHSSLKEWTISNKKFIELLDSIDKNSLTTITFEDIVKYDFKPAELRKKVILTFDDCPSSLFEFAVPELIKRKMKAVFYIPTAHIGGYNLWDSESQGVKEIGLINESQIKFLSSNGMEIGSHGVNHTQLTSKSDKTSQYEVLESKNILEAMLNKRIYSFSYPYAELPNNYSELLSSAGYKFGLSLYQPSQNPFALRRIGIHQSDTLKSISYKLSKRYRVMRAFADPVLALIKFVQVQKPQLSIFVAYYFSVLLETETYIFSLISPR